MKDLIEISVNGKVVASNERFVEGENSQKKICEVRKFGVYSIGNMVEVTTELYIGENEIRENDSHPPVEKKDPVVETPVQKQMGDISNPIPPASNYNEIPIKTRKPRGPNKPKEPIIEESVFDKPVEVETTSPAPMSTPITSTVTEVPVISTAPTTFTPTNARINELAKLIKMWCKASALKIETVNIDLLKAQAFDIVENDSDETIEAGIKEAARLMNV